MKEAIPIDLTEIYSKEVLPEFDRGRKEIEGILLQIKLHDLEARGLIRLASKQVHWEMPPKFPGSPLSEYVKEIKQ